MGRFHPNMIPSKLLGITFLEKEPKFFVCWVGGGWLLLAKGRMDLNVLGNCMKCIDCDTRVSVVPPGALVLLYLHLPLLFFYIPLSIHFGKILFETFWFIIIIITEVLHIRILTFLFFLIILYVFLISR